MKDRPWLLAVLLVVLVGAAQKGERRALWPTPREMELMANVEYGRVGRRPLRMDILRPRGEPEAPMPAIVFVHGGAWRAGSKEGARRLLVPLVRRGYLGATINYRLSGEATWPAQIHDCKTAVRYLRAHAEKYGIDPERIGVWGSSAGGHLVAMLGTSGGVEELEGEGGWPEQSSRVQAVCDWFGPSDLTWVTGRGQREESPVHKLLGSEGEELAEKARQASPVRYVSEDDPPFLIMHGEQDRVVPLEQSRKLHELLTGAGVECELHVVEGAGHGFNARDVLPHVIRFFDRHLRDGEGQEGNAAAPEAGLCAA